jgi:23S rRNA (cytidine1920-2'-O)/16S rRNA (cytidine1409-2'-O)-methyltransferase
MNASSRKIRADMLLLLKGLVPSRERARALILAGTVFSEGQPVEKAGSLYAPDAGFEIRAPKSRYVSRGGDKLESALRAFNIDVTGCFALDVGASTGGFTDCLLQHGCTRVIALDVGYGQLHWKLRNDPRVTLLERTNARTLQEDSIDEKVDLAVIDVSFISLAKVIPAILKVVKTGGRILALIKPQFEVGKGQVGKGGVVRDREKHRMVANAVEECIKGLGCEVKGIVESALLGPKGNREFFIYFVKERIYSEYRII